MRYTHAEIREMLSAQGGALEELFQRAARVKAEGVGNSVYLRGLIEYSNICRKNCLYCGIRSGNVSCVRYTLSDDAVLGAVRQAYEQGYGSVVLQGGENISETHISAVERLVREIARLSNGTLGVTLSFGEQSLDTYRRWRDAGAHRYLLRIESSDRELYGRIHPQDSLHSYDARVQALHDLRASGYQVGTGVMIGLPFQTLDHLAADLLFMQEMDIDMCGMGPYVVSKNTPLEVYAGELMSEQKRFLLTLRMIAVLRLMMPDINIAATTALQAIDPEGRLKAIRCGANVVMPNLTPEEVRGNYTLYNNKPLSLDSQILEAGVGYRERGDSLHYRRRVGQYVKKTDMTVKKITLIAGNPEIKV